MGGIIHPLKGTASFSSGDGWGTDISSISQKKGRKNNIKKEARETPILHHAGWGRGPLQGHKLEKFLDLIGAPKCSGKVPQKPNCIPMLPIK